MKIYHFYHQETGIFADFILTLTDECSLRANIPPDHIAHDGPVSDHLSQRFDIANGVLVDHQPPRPSSDHEWNTDSRRWGLNGAARARLDSTRAREFRRAELVNQQHALVRRLALNPADAESRAALESIDAEIHLLSESTSP